MNVRFVKHADASQIAKIYNFYIENSHATFETETICSGEMEKRINASLDKNYPFIVCEKDDELLGYTYARQFRPRRAYLHSIEISVYIKAGFEGKGIGGRLYENLFPEILNRNFHAIIAGVALPNEASIRLHEKFGMEKVAHFREVGFKFGRWVDVGYWELINQK